MWLAIMVLDSHFSKHFYVCALLNFLICSVTFGTYRAAADPTRVELECGPLNHVVMLLIFMRMFAIPCIMLLCICIKELKRYALMLDIYAVTILLCVEVMLSSMQLTQYRCYESLKTDPSDGMAIFTHAMALVITIDIMRIVYFAISREPYAHASDYPTDDEIELLLMEPEPQETPLTPQPRT